MPSNYIPSPPPYPIILWPKPKKSRVQPLVRVCSFITEDEQYYDVTYFHNILHEICTFQLQKIILFVLGLHENACFITNSVVPCSKKEWLPTAICLASPNSLTGRTHNLSHSYIGLLSLGYKRSISLLATPRLSDPLSKVFYEKKNFGKEL